MISIGIRCGSAEFFGIQIAEISFQLRISLRSKNFEGGLFKGYEFRRRRDIGDTGPKAVFSLV